MKKALWLLISILPVQTFASDLIQASRVLKDTTTPVALELTDKTVFCTDRGYGNIQLKISVPDLDWLAHFDHRVVGEGVPCMTAGRCSDALSPNSILEPNERIAIAPIRAILTERLQLDRTRRTCMQFLEEQIESTVRGRRFQHSRAKSMGAMDFEKCEKLVAIPEVLSP